MSRARGLLIVAIHLFLAPLEGISQEGIFCVRPDGIVGESPDPSTGASLGRIQAKGKEVAGKTVTDPNEAKIYVTWFDNRCYATTNFRAICPPQHRNEYRGDLDHENRFVRPPKWLELPRQRLLEARRQWPDLDELSPKLEGSYTTRKSLSEQRERMRQKRLRERQLSVLDDGFELSPKLEEIANLSRLLQRDPDDGFELSPKLEEIARILLLDEFEAAILEKITFYVDEQVLHRQGGTEWLNAWQLDCAISSGAKPRRVFVIGEKNDVLEADAYIRYADDVFLRRAAHRLDVRTLDGLDELAPKCEPYRRPPLMTACLANNGVLQLMSQKNTTDLSELLTQRRSPEGLPADWRKVMLVDLSLLSKENLAKGVKNFRELEANDVNTGDGPELIFTLFYGRAWDRLPFFVGYEELKFVNDDLSLKSVDRFGPIFVELVGSLVAEKLRIRPTAGLGRGAAVPVERVAAKRAITVPRIVFEFGHFDKSGSVIERLIKEARDGKHRDVHVVVGVCNMDWLKFIELYEAAMDGGALSVTFPTGPIDIPAMALMAVTLKRDPDSSLSRMSSPRTAVRKAYREAHRLLSEAADASSESERRAKIKKAFGDKAVEFFLLNGEVNKNLIDDTLIQLDIAGMHFCTFASTRPLHYRLFG